MNDVERTNGARSDGERELPIVIIGSGFSGLGMGILLKQAGIHSFTILEKSGDVGGTWRENVYPGAACDVPSHLYSYSFEPNPAWSRAFSPQREILDYLRRCAKKYGIEPHIRFHAEVHRAAFDDETATWTVHTKDGATLRARALVVGNGALHIPAFPAIPGIESFQGKAFHSARWDHDYDLNGKRVAVIGTGASAIQFVPQIAPKVDKLHLFQRTPPWIVPRLDRAFSDAEQAAFKRLPLWHRVYRAGIYWKLEAQVLGFTVDQRIMKLGEKLAKRHLYASIQDPRLRAALTPNYRMGCKRVLLSDDYYPALTRPNVELVTDPIDAITPAGVLTRSGALREVDAIIYGTGFNVSEYIAPIHISGSNGLDLNATWKKAPEAYFGITVSGFPNLYLLMGPNTGLGHNSMIFMIEAQARYALQCIQALRDRGLASMDVRPGVQASFNADLQEKLSRTVWASGCRSWYQTAGGRNSALWPGFTFDYWLKTRRVRLSDYVLR
jgi:cation diffusion facilitator CzcD-associated flavoprotein CzcO